MSRSKLERRIDLENSERLVRSSILRVRATGGLYFVTAVNATNGQPTSGMYISAGGSGWNTYSDRNAKTNFVTVDGHDILNRLAAIPILRW